MAPPIVSPYVKDGFNDYVVDGNKQAVNPENRPARKRRLLQLVVIGQVNPESAATERLCSTPADFGQRNGEQHRWHGL